MNYIKERLLRIGFLVCRCFLVLLLCTIALNIGLFIGELIKCYELQDELVLFLRLFKWI